MVLIINNRTGKAQVSESYQANWESLSKHDEAPEWFRDGKFGIYFHWGVYTVPAFQNEWYPRNMHIKGSAANKYHLHTYGEPTKFGYHDFVPMFEAEQFNAEEWAKLFKKAGARFAGPVAEHHDGFAMWDTKWSSWNCMDKGPKRDITAELEKAIRRQGMKFITTFHHARHWNGHQTKASQMFYQFIKMNYPLLLNNPELRLLYGEMSWEDFQKMWKGKLIEVIDKYRPDLMWFDTGLDLMPEKLIQDYLAYYFNKAKEWNMEVVVTYKHEDLPLEVGVLDYERGRAHEISEYPWLTDDSITRVGYSWCYTQNMRIKTFEEVLFSLVDIVSKNGQLLLNITPGPNGVIPREEKDILLRLGDWLERNGEAIYKTRPWMVYGEGPSFNEYNRLTQQEIDERRRWNLSYRPEDIRFTQSKDGNSVYAIFLGGPDPVMNLSSFAKDGVASNVRVHNVSLLSNNSKLEWQQDEKGLMVFFPRIPLNDPAVAIKMVVN